MSFVENRRLWLRQLSKSKLTNYQDLQYLFVVIGVILMAVCAQQNWLPLGLALSVTIGFALRSLRLTRSEVCRRDQIRLSLAPSELMAKQVWTALTFGVVGSSVLIMRFPKAAFTGIGLSLVPLLLLLPSVFDHGTIRWTRLGAWVFLVVGIASLPVLDFRITDYLGAGLGVVTLLGLGLVSLTAEVYFPAALGLGLLTPVGLLACCRVGRTDFFALILWVSVCILLKLNLKRARV